MRYERRFCEIVEAEQIPRDPKLSDLERIQAWAGVEYSVAHDTNGVPTIVWDVEGRIVYSEPTHWITKDENDCLTFWENDDFNREHAGIGENHDETPNIADILRLGTSPGGIYRATARPCVR